MRSSQDWYAPRLSGGSLCAGMDAGVSAGRMPARAGGERVLARGVTGRERSERVGMGHGHGTSRGVLPPRGPRRISAVTMQQAIAGAVLRGAPAEGRCTVMSGVSDAAHPGLVRQPS